MGTTTATENTTEEKTSVISDSINGVVKIITGEAPTASEHVWGSIVLAAGVSIASSKVARRRMSEGKEAVFGIFL